MMFKQNQVALNPLDFQDPVDLQVGHLAVEPDTWRYAGSAKVDSSLAQGVAVPLSENGNEIRISLLHSHGLIVGVTVHVRASSLNPLSTIENVVDVTDLSVDVDRCLTLPPRQRQVLDLLMGGKSNKEIARQLCLGLGTVKVHLTALLHNLGVNNRSAAAAVGARSRSHACTPTLIRPDGSSLL